nr:MAG TPA: hypothetical protein [Caudoviricetes sp.]
MAFKISSGFIKKLLSCTIVTELSVLLNYTLKKLNLSQSS